MERTTAPIMADQKLAIEKPGDSAATISKQIALTTKIKIPNVRIVKGNEIKLRMGFIIALITPKIRAVTIMAPVPVNWSPLTIRLVTQRASELTIILHKMRLNIVYLLLFLVNYTFL
jgi:hypothetical protein